MKKIVLCLCLSCYVPLVLANHSRTAKGLSETEQLGITAGVALACGVGDKLNDFELIASRIIANPTPTEEAEKEEFKIYAMAKLKAYQEQKKSPNMSCQDVIKRFNGLPIFKALVYPDGTVKLPEGRVIKPSRKIKTTENKKINPIKKKVKNK